MAEVIHGGENVDKGDDHGGHEGRVIGEAKHLEEDQHVEHDDVDAGELLEEWMVMAMVSCDW